MRGLTHDHEAAVGRCQICRPGHELRVGIHAWCGHAVDPCRCHIPFRQPSHVVGECVDSPFLLALSIAFCPECLVTAQQRMWKLAPDRKDVLIAQDSGLVAAHRILDRMQAEERSRMAS